MASQVISIHALCEEGDFEHTGFYICRMISIHALCEEGDSGGLPGGVRHGNFYPRPLRGGRRRDQRSYLNPIHISIHALCEEGDAQIERVLHFLDTFLSTPSARRAT